EGAVRGHVQRLERPVEKLGNAGALELMGDAGAGIDVGNLADGEDLVAGRPVAVEQGRLGRGNGVVAPIAGALEGLRAVPEKGPGNDAADLQRFGQREGDAANLVEPV